MNYIVGLDLAKYGDFSTAIIAIMENGNLKIIDSKIIEEFVKKYEPDHFIFKYGYRKFMELKAIEMEKLKKDGKVFFLKNDEFNLNYKY